MRIVLLRHGKPDAPDIGRLRANELHRWIESYNSAGLIKGHEPPQEAMEVAGQCKAIVCSDLQRSVESAEKLGVKKVHYCDPMFREMGLPYGNWSSLKCSPNTWSALFRLLWFFGYASNGESLRAGRLRASRGAERLKEIAQKHNSVLLVGHGFVNRFIAKQLILSGWQGSVNPGKKYWQFGLYEYNTNVSEVINQNHFTE